MLPTIKHSVFINVTARRVFETLTTSQGWDAWFTEGTTLDLKSNGEFTFRWQDWGPDHVKTEDHAKVLEIIQDKKFSFQWNPDEKLTIVTFTLEPRAKGTVVIVSDEGFQNIGPLLDCAMGWAEALTLLKFYLEHGVTYGKVPY